jgi:hypothetical protein
VWISGFELFDAVDWLDEEHDEVFRFHVEHGCRFFDFVRREWRVVW